VTQGDALAGYVLRAHVKHNRQMRHRASPTDGGVMLRSGDEPTVWAPKLVLTRLRCAWTNPAVDLPGGGDRGLDCLCALDPGDAAFLLMRAKGVPWKTICRHFSISRATAYRRLEYLLSLIAWRLNQRPVPAGWSRRFLVERTRVLSSRP